MALTSDEVDAIAAEARASRVGGEK